MKFQIETYPHASDVLWSKLGPICANRKLQMEMGSAIISDENYRWTLALQDGVVVGFGDVEVKKNVAVIHCTYVFEAYRSAGVYDALLKERMKLIKQLSADGKFDHVTAYTNSDQKRLLEKAGFIEQTQRGRFFVMRLDIVTAGA